MMRLDRPIDLDALPAKAPGTERSAPRRTDHRRAPPPRRSDLSPRRSSRSWLTWVVGGLVFGISFVIALLATRPARPPTPAMTMLASSTIPDLGRLMAAVKAAGLKGTPDVKGGIDEITRLDNDRVMLRGWAADVSDRYSPLAVMVFVDGRYQLTMETDGRRPEIAAALGLSDAASANVAFEGAPTCARGQRLIVVAVAQSGVYGHFGTRRCP